MRYVQDRTTGKLIPADEYYAERQRHHFIAPDIGPYKSMQTGEMIGSRSQHREHLRRHQLIEVGNEVNHMMNFRNTPKLDREKRKRDIANALSGYGH